MKTLKPIPSYSFLSIPLRGVLKSSFSLLGSLSQRGKRYGIASVRMHSLSSQAETILEWERDQPYDDGKVMEKDAALHLALSRLAGEFGKESMLSLQRFFHSRYSPVVSTGSLKLDLALGIGGLPKGRMVEIYGKEASGKTTLALHIVKEAQKLGGYCAYFDAENALDPSLAEAVGVNAENLLIARPSCAENSLSVIDTLVKSGSVDVIVVDSVAALVPQCELDGSIYENCSTLRVRLMTQGLRKINYSLCRSQTLLVLINQVRSNLKPFQGFVDVNETTCGGNALKFYSAVRMRMMRTGMLTTEDEISGINITVQVMKNKLAPAMKKAGLDVKFGKGLCCEAEVFEMACKYGVIMKTGNCYCINGEHLKDKSEAVQFLRENDDVIDELVTILRSQLFGSKM